MKRSLTPKTCPSKKFKSPLIKTPSRDTAPATVSSVQAEIETLKLKLQETDREINDLEELGCKKEELATHIEKLHEYNEIKDIGQMVLGRIAVTKVTELYQAIWLFPELVLYNAMDYPTPHDNWHLVGKISELKLKTCRKIYLKDCTTLALFFIAPDKFFLTNSACPHARGPLDQGDIEDIDGSYKVTCPLHYYSFDLSTGESSSGLRLFVYRTEIREDSLWALTHLPISLSRPKTGSS